MKFYWLKMDKNFFQQHDVRMIESMPNGKEMILFYIKLLAESVSHEGDLRFSDDIAYDNEMLAGITNTDISIVEQAMKLLVKLKLVEIKEDMTITMKEVATMTGCETDWARKKRQYREGHPEDNVLENEDKVEDNVRQSPIRDKSIDIRYKEKEIQKKKKADEVLEYFNRVCGTKYRSDKQKEYITARLDEGFTVEDFKKVVDRKYSKWHDDPKMAEYLRPETLFCKKHFESYLNEKDAKPKKFTNIEQHDYDFEAIARLST